MESKALLSVYCSGLMSDICACKKNYKGSFYTMLLHARPFIDEIIIEDFKNQPEAVLSVIPEGICRVTIASARVSGMSSGFPRTLLRLDSMLTAPSETLIFCGVCSG